MDSPPLLIEDKGFKSEFDKSRERSNSSPFTSNDYIISYFNIKNKFWLKFAIGEARVCL